MKAISYFLKHLDNTFHVCFGSGRNQELKTRSVQIYISVIEFLLGYLQ